MGPPVGYLTEAIYALQLLNMLGAVIALSPKEALAEGWNFMKNGGIFSSITR
jgi:hypothetical protein